MTETEKPQNTSPAKAGKSETEDLETLVRYKGLGSTVAFETKNHDPFEICCGTCFYIGFTETKEAEYKISICSHIFCLLCVCCHNCTKRHNQHEFHRTEHHCGNCGAILATADYHRNPRVRPYDDPWVFEDFEPWQPTW